MGFDELIIMMDSDDAGVKAAQDIAEALPVGKAKAKLYLQRCQRVSCKTRAWDYQRYISGHRLRPDGIVTPDQFRM